MTTQKSSAPEIAAAANAAFKPDRRARFALYAICFGFFLVVLDTTALNVAMTSIQHDLGGTVTGLQWVVNSYTMVFASLMLTCGAIGDRVGARRFYQLGLVLFTVMSALCGLSTSVSFLIAARALQGLGAAIMLPASLALLSHTFVHPDERTKAVAYWASIVSLGFAAGPFLGGVITNFIGWRGIFWMNVPIGITALIMVHAYVTEATEKNLRHIDWAGQILVALALFGLTYALIEAGDLGWTSPRILAAFAVSLFLAAFFVLTERRSTSPVLPGFLFANSTFSISVAIGLILNFCNYGILFIEAIYLQNIRHLNAFQAGLVILPLTALPTITTRAIVKYSTRKHLKARLIVGLLISALGGAALALARRDTGYTEILVGLGLLGIGMGCVMPAITAGVLAASPAQNSGVASGILNSSRQVGGTLGVALMGSIFRIQKTPGMYFCFMLVIISFLLITAVTAAIPFLIAEQPKSD